MEYFREVINLIKGRKGKSKPPLGEYIRMSRLKMQGTVFLLIKISALRNVRHYSRQVMFL